jgi:hypothetical protein
MAGTLLDLVMESMIAQAAKHPELMTFANEQFQLYGRGALIKVFSSSSEALSATSYNYTYVNEAVIRDIGVERINQLAHAYIPGQEYLLLYGITVTESTAATEYNTVFNGCIMKSTATLSALVEHPALVLEHPAPWGSCLRGDCTEKSAKWCSKCKDAKYCSSECQQMDWPSHSLNCEEAARCKKTAKLMMKRMLLC